MKTSFDFGKSIDDWLGQLEKVKQVSEKTKVDMSATISELEAELKRTREEIYGNLTGWQKVQMSRHPDRPQTLDYISMMCDNFLELHGDRTVMDAKAIIRGWANIDDQSLMIIGHQKGKNTKERQFRNLDRKSVV